MIASSKHNALVLLLSCVLLEHSSMEIPRSMFLPYMANPSALLICLWRELTALSEIRREKQRVI